MSSGDSEGNGKPDVVTIVTEKIANAPSLILPELEEHAKVLERVTTNAIRGQEEEKDLVDLIRSLGNVLEQLTFLSLRRTDD